MTSNDAHGQFGDSEHNRAEEAANHAERIAGDRGRFQEFVSSVKTLVAMLRAYRSGEFPMSWQEITLLVTALLYVVNPVDAVPEAAFGPAGLTDDAAVIVGAVAAMAAAIARFRTPRTA